MQVSDQSLEHSDRLGLQNGKLQWLSGHTPWSHDTNVRIKYARHGANQLSACRPYTIMHVIWTMCNVLVLPLSCQGDPKATY